MKNLDIRNTKAGRCFIFLALAFACNMTFAMSSMGRAKVSEVDGAPCFSVDEKRTDSLHFFVLYIWEKKLRQPRQLPKSVWQFSVNPPGRWVEISAQTSFCYGVTPSFAEGVQAEPLVPYQIYDVSIKADPQNVSGHVIAYGAEFCVKPKGDRKLMVHMIQWDTVAGKRNYEVCTKK